MVDFLSAVSLRRRLQWGPVCLLVGLMLLALSPTVQAQEQRHTFTVTSTGDGSDFELPDFPDETCSTSTGECTLRAAIQEANETANGRGPDSIKFDIAGAGPHTIQPESALPNITEPVIIDATTEPDYDGAPVVVVDGSNAGGGTTALYVASGGGLIAEGLSIVNFGDAAFIFIGDAGWGNRVRSSYLGVGPDGTTPAGNRRGIFIGSGAGNTRIGGIGPDEGNVISANGTVGLSVVAAAIIRGNRIGVDVNGDPLGNGGAGISINADDVTVGGVELISEGGNIIAHNGGDGVEVTDLTPPDVQNTIRGNQMYANAGLGIDLEGGTEDASGRTENDEGDADDGQNRLQNFPELPASSYQPSTEEITVAYRVPSDPNVDASGASDYPLSLHFYVADDDEEEGSAYLGDAPYYSDVEIDDYGGCGAPPCTATATFNPQSPVEPGDRVIATATDAAGNTSEFSSATAIDFPPRFVDAGPFNVRETASNGAFVGDVNATNGEGGAVDEGITYQITAGNDPDENGTDLFSINGIDGTLSIARSSELDFETREQYNLQVEAREGTEAVETTVTVNVTDVSPPTMTTDAATNVTSTVAQLNATVNPNGGIATVVFTYYPMSDSTATTTVTGASELSGGEPQAVSATVENLTPGTQYGYTVEATNGEGSGTGAEQTFTTDAAPPTVATEPATDVGLNSAQLNGTVTPNGGETTVTFEYAPAGQPGQAQTIVADQSPLTGSGEQETSVVVDGLDSGSEYVFRVIAENSAGSATGDDETFVTGLAPPEATTDPAAEVTSSSAQLNGTVSPNGSETTVSFEYFPSGQPDQAQTVEATQSPLTGSEEQAVSATVDGLAPGRAYSFRVSAENEEGSASGEIRTFTTAVDPPAVTTEPATDATVSGAQLHGTVNPNGVETSVVFEYFASDQPDQVETVAADQSPLSGSGSQNVSASVEGLQPGREYSFRVVAENDGGRSEGQQQSFSTLTLELSVERSVDVPDRGTPLDVEVTVSEGFEPLEAELFYRQVGVAEYQETTLQEETSTAFAGTVPGSAVTERGLEFYVRLAGEHVTGTVPETNPASQPIHVPVQVSRLEAGVELVADRYRMISVPVVLDTTEALAHFTDDFGGLDRTQWRLLRWSPEEDRYRELTAEGAEEQLLPGRAYWLITRDGQTLDGGDTFDVGTGRSVPASPISLTLPPGCSQMANPRAYPISWSDVEGREAVNDPVAYDPTAPDSLQFNVETLRPWVGYWVCNPGSSPVEVTVPRTAAAPAGARAARAHASEADPVEALLGREHQFGLQLSASLNQPDGRTLTDIQNVVGVAETGRPGVGREDVVEPPPIGDNVQLSVVEEGTRLAGSLRPAGKSGYSWDLEVTATEGEPAAGPRRVRVHLETYGTLPSGFDRRLVDRETGERIRLKGGTFAVRLTQEKPTRHLRLIVGAAEFVETKSETTRADRTGMRAVYPNPSRGAVTIEYRVTTPQPIRVAVYDLLGRHVRTLVDGRQPSGTHTVQWDGTTGSEPVASGLYIVRLQGESTSVSRRVSIVR